MGVEPIRANSSLVSYQQRDRLYWTNIPGIELPKDRHINFQDYKDTDEEYCDKFIVNRTPSRERMWGDGNGECPNVTNREKINCITLKQDRWKNSGYEIFKTYLYACNKEIFSNYKPTLYSSEVASLKQIVKDRFVGLQTYQGKISPGGQCLPGIQRFFVTVDGKFFPCERVDEESSELCIGDLKNGFDLENAKKILNVAKITEKECRECWCYKMCSQCVANDVHERFPCILFPLSSPHSKFFSHFLNQIHFLDHLYIIHSTPHLLFHMEKIFRPL